MAFYINQADSCDASVVIDDQNKGPFLSRVDQTDSAGVTVDKKKSLDKTLSLELFESYRSM